MVLASTILNFLVGGTFNFGFTTFFNPIRNTFGWGAAVTSIVFTFRGLETGMLSPVAGFLVDRLGPRKLMLPGMIIAGVGLLWMSRIDSLWAFYGSFLLTSMGLSFGTFVVINTAIANWFVKKRSRAMTLMYVGFGASGFLIPLVAWSISQFGWRESLVIIGISFWAIGIPISLIMRHKPSQYGYLPDGETPSVVREPAGVLGNHSSNEVKKQDSGSSVVGFAAKEALKTRSFWMLSFVFFFQQVAQSAVGVHIVPYLESVNIPRTIAATAVTGMTLCSLIGRISLGFLGDFKDKRYLIVIALVLQTVGILVFSFIEEDKVLLIVLFLLTYGPGYGGPIPLRPALQADYFGTKSFGTIMGLMALVGMLGGLVSPIVAGWAFDITGSYRFVWQIFALFTFPAIPLMLLAKPPVAKQET